MSGEVEKKTNAIVTRSATQLEPINQAVTKFNKKSSNCLAEGKVASGCRDLRVKVPTWWQELTDSHAPTWQSAQIHSTKNIPNIATLVDPRWAAPHTGDYTTWRLHKQMHQAVIHMTRWTKFWPPSRVYIDASTQQNPVQNSCKDKYHFSEDNSRSIADLNTFLLITADHFKTTFCKLKDGSFSVYFWMTPWNYGRKSILARPRHLNMSLLSLERSRHAKITEISCKIKGINLNMNGKQKNSTSFWENSKTSANKHSGLEQTSVSLHFFWHNPFKPNRNSVQLEKRTLQQMNWKNFMKRRFQYQQLIPNNIIHPLKQMSSGTNKLNIFEQKPNNLTRDVHQSSKERVSILKRSDKK